MTIIRRDGAVWRVAPAEPVGPLDTFFARLRALAKGGKVALGIDCPIGLPRAYAALHVTAQDFPAFLKSIPRSGVFWSVAATLAEIAPASPFYPARGVRGMTRVSHAQALGLTDAAALCRICDLATPHRPAGAPLFWTLGANQSGKAAISAWRDLLGPALRGPNPPRLWPFDGGFTSLLGHDEVVIAETYPAEALRQLGLIPAGSKRRQSDRAAYAPGLRAAMARLGAVPDAATLESVATGFSADSAGEDRFDCLLGALCVLSVVTGQRPDTVPDDPWVRHWEGWVLGQACNKMQEQN